MTETKGETSTAGCFLTVFRNLVGPGLLLAVGSGLIANRPSIGSGWDIVFGVVIVLVVLAGLVHRPESGPSQPGAASGFSRPTYVIVILAVAAAFWGVAHFVLRAG